MCRYTELALYVFVAVKFRADETLYSCPVHCVTLYTVSTSLTVIHVCLLDESTIYMCMSKTCNQLSHFMPEWENKATLLAILILCT